MENRLRKVCLGLGAMGIFGYSWLAAPLPAGAAAQPVQITSTPAMYPNWSTQIYYYVTRCASTIPNVHLQVTTAPSVLVGVDGQAPKTGTFTADVNNITAGQEFHITTSAQPSATYHVRCLPADFPAWTSTISGRTQSDFYVVTPSLSLTPGHSSPYVAVFDTNGTPRWWMNDTGSQPIDAKTLPNGDLVWSQFTSGGANPAKERALDGTVVRSYPSGDVGGAGIDFHELQVLPNGNYFLATDSQRIPQADLSLCGAPPGTKGPVEDPVIEELDPLGHIVWSWDAYSHIPLSEVDPQWRSQCLKTDAYHFNALEYVPATTSTGAKILVSFRHLDAIYKIDIASNKIWWKLGGSHRPESLTVKNDPLFGAGFGGQHDIRLMLDGTVTIHDNGTGRNRSPRAVRYQIDGGLRTATLVEQVNDPAVTTSACCGSVRKLPGSLGNWVVSWGGQPTIDELTPSGTIVFSLNFSTQQLFSYRAVPVTLRPGTRYSESPSWGDGLTSGMNTQFPRSPGA